LDGKCKNSLDYHNDKVQSVKWNPSEEKVIASGGLEGNIHVKAADNPKSGVHSSVPSSIESLSWNPLIHHELSISTEDGYFYTFDVRSMSRPLFEQKTHQGSSCFAFSPSVSGLLATAGKDKLVKLWDSRTMTQVAEREMRAEELFSVEFSKDLPFVLATGGLGGNLAVWDTEENESVRARWAS
jgi:periodic tryptophan protein 1